jgi:hypothetical protein
MIRGINTDGAENTITPVIRKSSTLVMEESLRTKCPPGTEQKEIFPPRSPGSCGIHKTEDHRLGHYHCLRRNR